MRPRSTISLLKESARALRSESVRPSRSTAILMATWVATFVLYLFVKPDHPVMAVTDPGPNTVPAAVLPATPPR
ncbi:hypothetical protein [Nocardia sp. NPDC049149]|uniref:hypothetical protein n=1 Tax=Nocardia sp. NPDC049149 TaxID=3364315 RepID=UPI00370FC9B8